MTDDYYNFHGFAPAAQLHAFTVSQSSRGISIAPHITRIMDTARSEGIHILNISLSSTDQVTDHESLDTVNCQHYYNQRIQTGRL